MDLDCILGARRVMDQIHEIIEELRQKDYKSFDTFYNLTKNQVFYAIINLKDALKLFRFGFRFKHGSSVEFNRP